MNDFIPFLKNQWQFYMYSLSILSASPLVGQENLTWKVGSKLFLHFLCDLPLLVMSHNLYIGTHVLNMFIFIVIIDVSLEVDLSSVELSSFKYNNNNELKLDKN